MPKQLQLITVLMTLYQCEAVVSSQHDDINGSGMVGHTDTATFGTVLPEKTHNITRCFSQEEI